MRYSTLISALALATAVGACTLSRQTSPPRTATEQLLISKAADDAAARLDLKLPAGTKIYLNPVNFDGTDARYAVGAIRDELLKDGALLVPFREGADVTVDVRMGALSIDRSQTFVGLPPMDIPVPLSGTFSFPGISLYSQKEQKGVAKFVATAVDADGRLVSSTNPRFGYSHRNEWVALVVLAWTTSDIVPSEQRETLLERIAPAVPQAPLGHSDLFGP